jgi:hypothetical protein
MSCGLVLRLVWSMGACTGVPAYLWDRAANKSTRHEISGKQTRSKDPLHLESIISATSCLHTIGLLNVLILLRCFAHILSLRKMICLCPTCDTVCVSLVHVQQKLESSGIVIPEGTEVLLSLYLLSRNVEEWGAPIDTFNPDRFLTAGPGGTLAVFGCELEGQVFCLVVPAETARHALSSLIWHRSTRYPRRAEQRLLALQLRQTRVHRRHDGIGGGHGCSRPDGPTVHFPRGQQTIGYAPGVDWRAK